MKRFAYIDAMRGYAVLCVIIVHTSQYCGLSDAGAFGARGVQLFFVASALTLMSSWHQRNDGTAAFFIRRVCRIAPMFWLSIPIYIALIAATQDARTLDPVQIVGAAFLLQAARPDWILQPIVPGGWSVCVEAAFYCLFPLLAAVVTSQRRAIALMLASAAAADIWMQHGLAAVAALFPGTSAADASAFLHLSLPIQLPAFAAGVLAFFTIADTRRLSLAAREITLAGALAGGAYLAATDPHNITAFSLCFGVIAVSMAGGAGRYLINPAIVHVGRYSFSIYLLHWIGISIGLHAPGVSDVTGVARFALLFPITTLAATAMAAITYRLVEQPAISLGKRLISALALRADIRSRPDSLNLPWRQDKSLSLHSARNAPEELQG